MRRDISQPKETPVEYFRRRWSAFPEERFKLWDDSEVHLRYHRDDGSTITLPSTVELLYQSDPDFYNSCLDWFTNEKKRQDALSVQQITKGYRAQLLKRAKEQIQIPITRIYASDKPCTVYALINKDGIEEFCGSEEDCRTLQDDNYRMITKTN